MSKYMRRPPSERRPGRRSGRWWTYAWKMGRGDRASGALRALDRRDGRGAHLSLHRGRVREARWEARRAVGMRWPAKRMRVSPSPTPALVLPAGVTEGRVRLNNEGREP